jgi:hypothetical protein
MVEKEESKERKRMVVEEVETSETPKVEPASAESFGEAKETKPDILEDGAKVSSTDVIASEETKPIEESPKEVTPIEPKKQKSPIFWILVPGIFLLGAILGGVVFYQRGVSSSKSDTASPTPVASATTTSPTPSASPSATVDLTKYTVNILNGSGIAGEASKVKDLLVTAGFKVGTTGNAATYDYTKTIIKAKSTVDKAFLTKLSSSLAKTYVVGDSQTLTSGTTDVQVIVGTSKAE